MNDIVSNAAFDSIALVIIRRIATITKDQVITFVTVDMVYISHTGIGTIGSAHLELIPAYNSTTLKLSRIKFITEEILIKQRTDI